MPSRARVALGKREQKSPILPPVCNMMGIRLESSTTDGMQPALSDCQLPSCVGLPLIKRVLDTLAGVSAAMQENQDRAGRGHPALHQRRPIHAATWENFVNCSTGPLVRVCTKEPPA